MRFKLNILNENIQYSHYLEYKLHYNLFAKLQQSNLWSRHWGIIYQQNIIKILYSGVQCILFKVLQIVHEMAKHNSKHFAENVLTFTLIQTAWHTLIISTIQLMPHIS